MTRQVRWADEARDELNEIAAYIADFDSSAATRLASRILITAEKLGEMATGHPGRVPKTYEKLVAQTSYNLAYEVHTINGMESIYILRVIHSSRNWTADEWPE